MANINKKSCAPVDADADCVRKLEATDESSKPPSSQTLSKGPFVGALVNRYGFRPVSMVGSIIGSLALVASTFSPSIFFFQLTYGVLGGLGFGMVYLPASVAVGYYFESKRALATGIAMCGSGLGTSAMPPFAKYLLSELGWKSAHFIFAALMMQVCVSSSLMRPLRMKRKKCASANNKEHCLSSQGADCRNITHHTDGVLSPGGNPELPERLHSNELVFSITTHSENTIIDLGHQQRLSCLKRMPKPMADILADMLDPQVLRSKGMIILCLANLCGIIGFYMALLFTADRAVRYGLSKEQAALLLSILGICNTAGRVLTGAVAYIPKVPALLVNNICMTLAGVTMTLIPTCTTFTSMALASAAFGLFFSSFFTLWSVIICDLVGLEKLTNGYGLILLVRSVGCLVGPPFGGHLYDSIGDYDATFFMGGACILTSTCLYLLLHLNYFKTKAKITEKA